MTRVTRSLITVLSRIQWGPIALAALVATCAAAAEIPANYSRDSLSWNAIAQNSATASQQTTGAASVTRARYLWSKNPHGKMLERILPRVVEPDQLSEPQSEGARLTVQYCVQCHYLPSPQMHTAANWGKIVARMNWRMQGKGNMGKLMKDMMDNIQAPTEEELETLTHYLQKHGQKEIEPRHPGLASPAGQMFSIACSQCHALPDPRRHTAREWPQVVQRMKQHMSWANVVVGIDGLRTDPVLRTGEIIRFLQRYARDEHPAHKP